jgi:nicotinamidase-related amidase
MSQRALIVIDVQNDYFPGGAWTLPNAEKALPNILRLIAGARSRNEQVIFIQHVTPAGSPVFAEGSRGMELHTDLVVREADALIRKSHPSSFQETGLHDRLQSAGIQAVDVCGFMTQMCCDSTTRDAYGRGYKVRLFKDACAAMELEVEGEKIPHETVHRVSLGALSRFAKILPAQEGG